MSVVLQHSPPQCVLCYNTVPTMSVVLQHSPHNVCCVTTQSPTMSVVLQHSPPQYLLCYNTVSDKLLLFPLVLQDISSYSNNTMEQIFSEHPVSFTHAPYKITTTDVFLLFTETNVKVWCSLSLEVLAVAVQPVIQSVSQSVFQSVSHSFSLSVSHSVFQPASQSFSQSFSLSVSHSVSQ